MTEPDFQKQELNIKQFEIFYAPRLDDSGFGNILAHFNPKELKYLQIIGTNLKGNSGAKYKSTNNSSLDHGTEFLPHLSKFMNLRAFQFSENPECTRIGTGSFLFNFRLTWILFKYLGQIKVEENAFFILPVPPRPPSILHKSFGGTFKF